MAPPVRVHRTSALTFVSLRPRMTSNATSPRTDSSFFTWTTPTMCNTSATHGSRSACATHHAGTTASAPRSCVICYLVSSRWMGKRASRFDVRFSHSRHNTLVTTSPGHTTTTLYAPPTCNEEVGKKCHQCILLFFQLLSQQSVFLPQLPHWRNLLWVLLLRPVVLDVMDLVSNLVPLLVAQLLSRLPRTKDFINIPVSEVVP